MWIPQIVKYIMSFVICISYGNTKVVHIGINLLATMGISFFMYSLVCLCAMITGQLVSVAVMYAVVNLLYGGAVIAIANVLTYVSYGLSLYGICKENKCYVVCTHATASQSGRLSSDHEECGG